MVVAGIRPKFAIDANALGDPQATCGASLLCHGPLPAKPFKALVRAVQDARALFLRQMTKAMMNERSRCGPAWALEKYFGRDGARGEPAIVDVLDRDEPDFASVNEQRAARAARKAGTLAAMTILCY